MQNNLKEFGLRLKEVRTATGMSGYRLAKLLDVEPPNITYWERGRSYPRVDKLIRLSEILGVNIDWLLKGAQHENT